MPPAWKEPIVESFRESARLKEQFAEGQWMKVRDIALLIAGALKRGRTLLLFGNGGSAADAQHIAAELVNRFRRDRAPLPAIALTTDTSVLTCIGNDSNFSEIFSRQISALGRRGDIALGISTSGNSDNIVRAFKAAREKGLVRVALLGRDGGRARRYVDHAVIVPSFSTPRIQEVHITIGHILCEIIEEVLFPR